MLPTVFNPPHSGINVVHAYYKCGDKRMVTKYMRQRNVVQTPEKQVLCSVPPQQGPRVLAPRSYQRAIRVPYIFRGGAKGSVDNSNSPHRNSNFVRAQLCPFCIRPVTNSMPPVHAPAPAPAPVGFPFLFHDRPGPGDMAKDASAN